MKFIVLAFVMLSMAPQESHAFGMFRRKKSTPAPQQVTLVSQDHSFGAATFEGTGCGGSSSVSGNAISVLWDAFKVEAGRAAGTLTDTKRCTVKLPISIGAGEQLIVNTADIRGSYSVVSQTGGSLSLNYRLTKPMFGGQTQVSVGNYSSRKDFATATEDFTVSDEVSLISKCGGTAGTVNLTIDATLQVATNANGDQVLAAVDSLDAASKAGVTIKKIACK